jgi:hypothetical protein
MQENSQSVMDFQPVDFDATELPPEAEVGGYEAVVDSTKLMKTSKDGYPMIVVEWKLESAIDDANKASIGATVSDFVTFFPKNHKAYRLSVQRFRGMVDALGINPDVLPERLQTKQDFADLLNALKNKRTTVWVSHQADKQTGEPRTKIAFTAPKGSGGLAPINGNTGNAGNGHSTTSNKTTTSRGTSKGSGGRGNRR